jgi:hypothetical protein
MGTATIINDVLDGHVALEIDCIDRLYLNAYVPNLQVGGQVNRLCREHLGMPISAPAVIEKIGNRFRREVAAFAKDHEVPILMLRKPDRSRFDDRKLDHVRPYLDRAAKEERFGVVAIGGRPGVPVGVLDVEADRARRGCVFRLVQGAAPRRDLLLRLPRSSLRARVHQDLHVLSVSRQSVAERA